MTDPNYTYLAIVVDRSGSMNSIREDAEGGIKTLIGDQRKEPGKLSVNLFQFDTVFDEIPEKIIDTWSLKPRGGTALNDAIGKSVTIVGERLASLSEDERPSKVIFVVTTDGMENASKEWTRASVKNLIDEQTNTYGWQFLFTAANQDASLAGADYGITATMNFAPTGAGVRGMYDTSSSLITSYRSGVSSKLDTSTV